MEQLNLPQRAELAANAQTETVEIINQRLKAVAFAPVSDIREAGPCTSLTAENAHYLVLKSKIRTRRWTKFAKKYNGENVPDSPAKVSEENLWELGAEEQDDFSTIILPTCSRVACPKCHGEGTIPCEDCHGKGQVKCKRCGGSGEENENYNEVEQQVCGCCNGAGCSSCNWKGYIVKEVRKSRSVRCSVCQGAKVIPCKTCSGNGNLQCPTCEGSGIVLAGFKLEQCNSVDERILYGMSNRLGSLIAPLPTQEQELGKCTILHEFTAAGNGADLSGLCGDHAGIGNFYAQTMQELNQGKNRCGAQAGKLVGKTFQIYSFKPENIADVKNPSQPLDIAVSAEDRTAFVENAMRSLSEGDFYAAQEALNAGKRPEALRKGLIAMFKSGCDPEITEFVGQLISYRQWGVKAMLLSFIPIFILFSLLAGHAVSPVEAVWTFTIFGMAVAWAVCRATTCNLIWRSPLPFFRFDLNFIFYWILSLLAGIAMPILFCFCKGGNLGNLFHISVFLLVVYPWFLLFFITTVRKVCKAKLPEPGNPKAEAKIRKVERKVTRFAFRNPWPEFAVVFGPVVLVYLYQIINILTAK